MSAVENNVIWFGCAPAEVKSGDIIVTAVGKSGAKYSKTVTLSGEKSLSFVQGKVAPFSVDMTVAPVIDADDVANLSADEHSLEQIVVNIINPVAGASLSAETDGAVVTDCDLIDDVWYYSVSANTGEERTGWIKFSYKSGENVLAEKTVNVKQLAAGAAPVETKTATAENDYLKDNQGSGVLDEVISYSNNSSSTGTELRIYKGKTLTISAKSGYSIKKVELTCTKKAGVKYGFDTTSTVSVDDGATASSTATDNVGTITITGKTTKVAYVADKNQMRVTKISVTYIKD